MKINPENYFEVITGNADFPVQIIETDPIKRRHQLANVPKHLIQKVPIEVTLEYDSNLIKTIQKVCGCPTT